jgi:hypothetical protein
MAPEPLSLPVDDWKGWLEERARGQLRHAGDAIAALKDAAPADEVILQVWNDAGIALDDAAAVCSLLSVVHPDPAVIGLAEQIELEVQAFRTDLFLDADVFALLDSVDPALLDPAEDPAAADGAPVTATVSVLSNVVVLDVSVEVAPRVAARTDAVAATSSTTSTTTASGATAAPPSQVTYLLAVPIADVPDLLQAVGFHRLYVSIPAEGTVARPNASADDAQLVGGGR